MPWPLDVRGRVTLRRDGSTIYTALACICGKKRRFSAFYDDLDGGVDRLFKPIDKINKDIKEAGWAEDVMGPHDWCSRCIRYRKARTRRKKKKKG